MFWLMKARSANYFQGRENIFNCWPVAFFSFQNKFTLKCIQLK